jgi:porin
MTAPLRLICRSFQPACLAVVLAGWLAMAAVPAAAQAAGPADPRSAFSPGAASTAPEAALGEIDRLWPSHPRSMRFERPLAWMSEGLDRFHRDSGFRIGVAHTMLFGQPTGGLSDRSGAAGDLDLMTSWTILGRGTEDTGRLVATAEYRYDIGAQPPSVIGGQNGTLINTTNSFNDRGGVVRDLFWIQSFYDARLRILLGRADPSDYVGAHLMQNVNNSFVSRHFSANPAVPFPGHGPMAGFSLRPTDLFYLSAGTGNANSNTQAVEFNPLGDGRELFCFAEAGYTPTLEGLGPGRYAVGYWNMDPRTADGLPSDQGLTVIADQRLSERLQIFGRYAHSDGTLTNVSQLLQAGVGINGLIGRDEDLSGLAVSFARPQAGASQNEKVIEVFHRLQVRSHSQLSLGAQLIINPGNAPDEDTMGFFFARLRTSF